MSCRVSTGTDRDGGRCRLLQIATACLYHWHMPVTSSGWFAASGAALAFKLLSSSLELEGAFCVHTTSCLRRPYFKHSRASTSALSLQVVLNILNLQLEVQVYYCSKYPSDSEVPGGPLPLQCHCMALACTASGSSNLNLKCLGLSLRPAGGQAPVSLRAPTAGLTHAQKQSQVRTLLEVCTTGPLYHFWGDTT